MDKSRPALLAIVCALGLSACGGSGPSSTRTIARQPPPTTTGTQPRAPHTAPPRLARVGAAQPVHAPGTTLIVTVDSVIDPLRGSGVQVLPGMKPVSILVTVRDAGPGGYDGSATGDFSMRSNSGPASPVFVPSGQCQTPLRDFMNEISADEVRQGCVTFAIPHGEAPAVVRFAASAGAGAGGSRYWGLAPH